MQVVIAGDGRYEDLSRLSMVLSRYGDPDKMSGAVGVLGPTHINYGRAISTVRYVSNFDDECAGDAVSGRRGGWGAAQYINFVRLLPIASKTSRFSL